MNIVDLLIRDHAKVLALFDAFDSLGADEAKARRELLERIHDELEAHAGAEEQHFYPMLEAKAPELTASPGGVGEAREEHRLIRDLLSELAGMAPDEDGYAAKFRVARDMVRHHVQDEERSLLPRARGLVAAEELDRMGDEIESHRTEVRTAQMAVAAPDAAVPPPDDGPPSDWVTTDDVMATASERPETVHRDDPTLTERPGTSGRPARPARARKKGIR